MNDSGGRKMLSTLNRLALVARHFVHSPAAVINGASLSEPYLNRGFSISHRQIMYRVEERGAPNTLEHRIFFREFASHYRSSNCYMYSTLLLDDIGFTASLLDKANYY